MTDSGKIRFIHPKDHHQTTAKKAGHKPTATKSPNKDTEENQAAWAVKFAEMNQEDYAKLADSPRRRAREAALLLSFQMDMGGDDWQLAAQVLDDIGLDASGDAFARLLAKNAADDRQNSDILIGKYAREWTLDRFAAIDRNILRLAISELLRDEQDNASIIINEAIELAKKFGDENSSAFVNGILNAIAMNELVKPPPKERPK